MADEDIQPLVCDNGTGMVKVSKSFYCGLMSFWLHLEIELYKKFGLVFL